MLYEEVDLWSRLQNCWTSPLFKCCKGKHLGGTGGVRLACFYCTSAVVRTVVAVVDMSNSSNIERMFSRRFFTGSSLDRPVVRAPVSSQINQTAQPRFKTVPLPM